MPSEASLANLRPPWQAGQSGNTAHAKGYRRVLAASRKCSLEAIEKAIACMRDDTAAWPPRLKAIELILDRAWGAPDQRMTLDGDGIATLRIQFVDPRDQASSTVIDAETFQITLGPEAEES